MVIIKSSDARAVAALIDARPASDPAVQRRVATIVDRVRREGDRALLKYARTFDGLTGPIEIPRREIEATARRVHPTVRKAIALASRNIRAVAEKQRPRPWTISPISGVTIRQRVLPLDRVGCYVPGGRYPLPSSLLMTAIPARVAGVPDVIAVCPKPDPTVMYAALEAGVSRLFRLGGAHAIAALAYGTASVPRVDRIVGPGNAYVAAAKSLVSRDCAIDFFAGPSEIAVLSTSGRPAWIAADLIAQAEHDPDARALLITPSLRLAKAVASEVQQQLPSDGPARQALASHGGIIKTRTLDEAIALLQRLAPEHAVCDSEAVAARLTRAGTVFVGHYSAQACGDYVTGSNHVLPTGGAAAARGGLSTADFVRVATVQRVTIDGLRRIAPAGIALAEAEGLRGHADSLRIPHGAVVELESEGALMTHEYEKVITPASGLRLHLNENTAGCSPKVIDALRRLTRHDIAFYPDYDEVVAACATRLGLTSDQLVLTNGLDEGILALTIAALRERDATVPEAVVVVPAFDMYASTAAGVGARVVEVPLGPDFALSADRILAAIGPQTRLLFLTSPNNPTGLVIPQADIVRIARRAPHVQVLVDEAYAEFSHVTLLGDPEIAALPNVFIGRTFAKAYGLAGLRAGVVIGDPAALVPIRRIVPPFSLNACAAAALVAGLGDQDYFQWYLAQVRTSKTLLYEALGKAGIRFWPSDANFVLAQFGDRASEVVNGLAVRGVHVRDKSRDPACPGCIRITTGVVEHTQACIRALEEVLCGAA